MLIEKIQNQLSLTKRKIIVIIIVWLICIILHNVISALLGFEEALFFILGVIVVPAYFLSSVLYSVIIYVRFRK